MEQQDNEPIAASFDVTQLEPNNGKYTTIPDKKFSARKVFNLDVDWEIPGFENDKNPNIPKIDPTYQFDPTTTKAILAGFSHNRRVMVQGYHGTGKSTHIEQVAARLNWACVRINLDSHISRLDLLGKDMITLKEGKQITEYKEGILPWALQNPVALVFDEYDAGRPDVMFVIQRILESEGRLTLLDQNKVIRPHPAFRLFSTSNTVGLGDATGLYHGTQQLNQGQMDRWNIVTALNYLNHDDEVGIMMAKHPKADKEMVSAMVQMATLTREGFKNGDISTVMSPRTVLSWIENTAIFDDINQAFIMTFLNKSDDMEHLILKEYYQRCFGVDL